MNSWMEELAGQSVYPSYSPSIAIQVCQLYVYGISSTLCCWIERTCPLKKEREREREKKKELPRCREKIGRVPMFAN